MAYDRDLKWLRRLVLLAGGGNAAVVVGHIVRRQWFLAVSGGIYVVTMVTCLFWARIAQAIRDNSRVLMAAPDERRQATDKELREYLKWLEGGARPND